MDPLLRRVLLLRVALPIVGIAIAFAVSRARGFRIGEQYALRAPPARAAAVTLALWGVWIVVSDRLGDLLGVEAPPDWRGLGTALLAANLVGMVITAPALEELLFRGVLFTRLSRSRLGTGGAVIATALLFSLLHFQYGPAEWALIALDGIGLGLARAWTGSVPLAFAMHAIGNCYAFLERVRVL